MIDFLISHLDSLFLIYLFVFLIAFLENFIVTGWFFPGTWIIILISFIAKTYNISFYGILGLAFLGNLLGSLLSYYLGNKFGKKALDKGFLFFKKEFFEQAKDYYNKNYILSLVFGKVIPGIKESIGFIAGAFQLRFLNFIVFISLGIFIWACVIVFVGYAFSNSIFLAEKWFHRIGLLFAILFIVFALLSIFRYYLLKFGNIFYTIIKFLVKFIFTPFHIKPKFKKYNNIYVYILALFGIFLLFLAYIGIFKDFYNSFFVSYLDNSLQSLLLYLRYEFFVYIALFVSFFGKFSTVFIGMFLFSIYLIKKNDKQFIVPLWIGFIFVSVIIFVLKIILARPRPEFMVYLEQGFSFPSFHAGIAMFFYGFLSYYFFSKEEYWKLKIDKLTLGVIVILFIGFSRVYLDVHYLSDVLGGYIIGFVVLLICIVQVKYGKKTEFNLTIPKYLSIFLSIILLGFFVFYVKNIKFVGYRQLGHNIVNVDNVLNYFDNNLNLKYTTTLFARKTQPINFIILAKDDNSLKDVFLKAGFKIADKLSFRSLGKLGAASYDNKIYLQAPMTPLFWNGKVQIYGFQKQLTSLENRHHIRVRKTDFKYNGYNVYVAAAVYDKRIKWGITHEIDPNLDKERDYFFKKILYTGLIKSYKLIQLVDSCRGYNFSYDKFFTDGKAYLLVFKK